MSAVVVIGGGHNGLVAALTLAKAGVEVTLVERSPVLGGICRPIEFALGHVCPGLLHESWFDPKAVGVTGVEFVSTDSKVATADGMQSIDTADSDWGRFVRRVRPFLRTVLTSPPPPLLPDNTRDLLSLGRTGMGLRRLGRADMTELMRVPPMCAADWVNEHFSDTPALAEAVAARGSMHGFTGPWSAGTAANLLLAEVMRADEPVGGHPALIDVLGSACASAGVTIHTDTQVVRIVVEDGTAIGVETSEGQQLKGSVLATCDPKTTMLDLVAPGQLPVKIERQFDAVRARGTTAKLMLAFDAPPDFGADRLYVGAGSIDGLERAFDAIKYGTFSDVPVLDVRCYGSVVSVLAGYVPHTPRGGWSAELKEELQAKIVGRLESAVGSLPAIEAATLWTPADIEREFALQGGCLHHVEHALDQMFFMRPTPSTAQYATPIAGLFLGGGGNHPCGGVTGLPGRLAADQLLRSRR